ncbi:ABC transporter substrate-binding protein [Numidum massiliense]|uniref:ABC transporter substrate-binding protein n=1 Tax=Numidum massiliense TaxID=1522315 RepID=UPI0006D562F5|nr:ABC transporter substrate-binding protein [Numidum massiliense]
MKRKAIIVWIVLLVSLLAVGCNSEGTDGAKEKKGAEPAELTLWVAGNSKEIQKTFKEVVDAFNKEYEAENIRAKVQFEPWSELDQKLTTSLVGGVGPDVFMHGAAAAASLANENQIESLKKYYDSWDDKDDFVEAYVESGKVNDEPYIVPIQGANRMMYYRKDIFEEAGVEVPETWDELLKISKKLVKKDGDRFKQAATELPREGNDLQQVWSMFLWSNNGDFLNEEGTESVLNRPEAVEALEYYKKFFDDGLTPISGMSGQGDQHPLGTGEVAFTFDGVWVIEQVQNYTPDAYDLIDVAVPPRGKGETTTHVGSSGFFMNANSKHKDAAWKLMAFLGSKENVEKISRELKFLPVRESTAQADFIKEDKLFAKFVELSATTNGMSNPNVPGWTTMRDIIASHVEKAIYGQVPAEEALKQAHKAINEEIQKNKK